MRGLGLVALREIRERSRSKAFIATSVITLLLVAGLILIPPLLGGSSEYRVGVVGSGNEAIVDAAQRLATANDDSDTDPSVVFTTTPFATRDEGVAALESGIVDAVLVDGTEVVVENVGWGGSGVVALLQRGAGAVELELLLIEQGEAAARVIEVMTSDPLDLTTTSGGDPQDESRYVVAYAGLLLLYLAVLLYGSWILTGVTEEKSSRVVEVLLAALRPWQLLGGKVLGIGALGIGQFVVTIAIALAALRFSGIEFPPLDPVILANLILWFVVGFLIFAVLFGAAGALAPRTEDAQNVAFPMSMVAVVGFFVSMAALTEPAGTVATIGTFVPITAPFVVPVRVALEAIPAWQFVVALALSLAAVVFFIWVAGRIYAGALLRYGGKVKVREAWRGASE